jgi:repressor LexA
MSLGLTTQQFRVYEVLQQRHEARQPMPTYLEIAVAIGLKSKSGIHRLIEALEARGLLRRLPDRRRCLELIDPDDPAEQLKARLLLRLERLPEGKVLSKSELIALVKAGA